MRVRPRLVAVALAAASPVVTVPALASLKASPKPLPQLFGVVGPGARFTLKNKAGKLVTSLKTGKYAISLNDYSTTQNFHIVGPGLDVKTPVKKKASAATAVVLKPGTFRYYSDSDKKRLKGSFKVVA